MIRIIARSEINPSDLSHYLDLAHELVSLSRTEPGCLEYGLWQSLSDPSVLTMIETWADAESLERHSQTDHFRRIVPLLASMRTKSTVERYGQTL